MNLPLVAAMLISLAAASVHNIVASSLLLCVCVFFIFRIALISFYLITTLIVFNGKGS